MDKSRIKSLILIIIGIILVSFIVKIVSHSIKASRNNANVEKIVVGMNKYEMLRIMGKPDNIDNHPVEKDIQRYYYEPPIGSSDGIYIYIGSDNKVVKIIKSD